MVSPWQLIVRRRRFFSQNFPIAIKATLLLSIAFITIHLYERIYTQNFSFAKLMTLENL